MSRWDKKTGGQANGTKGTNGTNGTHQGFEQQSRNDAKLGRELGQSGWFEGSSGGVRAGVGEDFFGRARAIVEQPRTQLLQSWVWLGRLTRGSSRPRNPGLEDGIPLGFFKGAPMVKDGCAGGAA